MKMAQLRGSHSHGSVLGPKEREAHLLVEIRCRAWTSALFGCGKWSEFELQRQQRDYSCHDQHTVFIPALRSTIFIELLGY
jgi:hypothetical protein